MKSAKTRALHKKHAGTVKHASKAKHTPTAHKKSATAHKQTARGVAKSWLTWGRWHDPACFPDAVIEEAWAVTW